ncbi:mitotic spindle assembly checkpoint protein MAD1-like [Littorina saxatilis]|uniref:mitotic spindle assembly checkpoint protein MAD1-like n=1 Tax=Littorina saxatilis TaxID=31220 RepID=UPI0038B4E405
MDKSPGGGLRESHKSSAYSSRNAHTDAEAPQRYAQHSSHFEQDEGASQQYVSRLPSHFESSTRSAQEGSRQRSSRDSHRSRAESGGEKQLRGGVYSSPMPLGKTRLSQREVSDEDGESRQRDGESDRARWSQTSLHLHTDHTATSSQSPLQDQVLSPRTRLSLREKHAKHMADLRAYYEAEVQDLRHKLGTMTGDPLMSFSVPGGRETARERILQEEIHGLRQQLRELQDSLDDAHIHNRELEQKLQGLEIRAADYAERYEESQQNVLKLKNRLEELHSYAKDRESVLEQVQSSERRQAAALQEMYKAQEEQGEAARRDKTALKRVSSV